MDRKTPPYLFRVTTILTLLILPIVLIIFKNVELEPVTALVTFGIAVNIICLSTQNTHIRNFFSRTTLIYQAGKYTIIGKIALNIIGLIILMIDNLSSTIHYFFIIEKYIIQLTFSIISPELITKKIPSVEAQLFTPLETLSLSITILLLLGVAMGLLTALTYTVIKYTSRMIHKDKNHQQH